jgi:hypothetical protein
MIGTDDERHTQTMPETKSGVFGKHAINLVQRTTAVRKRIRKCMFAAHL